MASSLLCLSFLCVAAAMDDSGWCDSVSLLQSAMLHVVADSSEAFAGNSAHASFQAGGAGAGPTYVTWALCSLIAVVSLSSGWQFFYSRLQAPPSELKAFEENVAREASASVVRRMLVDGLFIFAYIAISITMIKYNQWLMKRGHFPFAANLTFGHQCSGGLFLFVAYCFFPRLFPSLSDRGGDSPIDSKLLLKGILPIAACFSGQLVLSNMAYSHVSLAFIQMMKEGNMVAVYALSLCVGLELFDLTRAQVLFCLLLSTALMIQGEMSFSLIGIVIQGSGQAMESIKLVTQGLLLSARGSKRLDSMTYNLLIQPSVAFCIGIFLCVAMLFFHHVPTASWSDYAAWWPHLLMNACVALCLNITITLVIARTSAVTFVVGGIVKDICVVALDVVVFGTKVSGLQIVAFALQTTFVSIYSLSAAFSRQQKPEEPKASADVKK